MGYKAWVGGKSAWIQTEFGTKREFGKHVGTGEAGVKQLATDKREYIFLGMDGNYYSSPSKSAAKNLAGPGAIQVSEKNAKNIDLIRELRRKKRRYNKR